MDLKVYEGYKHNSVGENKTTKNDAQNLSAFNQAFKTPGAQTVVKNTNNKPRIAMFIDVDNVGISRENLLEIIFYINGKYQIEQCRLYGFSDESLPGIREIAGEYNLTTIGKMKFKQTGVNCLDSRLLIDAYECASNNRQKIDMIFLWCYPCDLSELFEKMIALGVNTSTIDNSIFDCKNKFVSQTFKLYSPYNFSLEQSTYGKVRNQPAEIEPNENIEKTVNANNNQNLQSINEVKSQPQEASAVADTSLTSSNTINEANQTAVPEPVAEKPAEIKNESPKDETTKPSILDDDFVPPVLPRRTIVERSNPNAPKKEPKPEDESISENTDESDTSTRNGEDDSSATSLVEEIARKLNLPVPNGDDISREMEQFEEQKEINSNLIMDLLKKAGFEDLIDGEKSLKYEDTIGDL